MKTEFTDVSETQKTLTIEIPSDVVDAEIDRIARDYTKQARIPGFRPGKVPATVVKQRFKDQILHDVMHGLIPRAVEEALQERGIEPVDTPNIKDVALEEGQPLKFTAAIETVPPFDPGDLSTISLTAAVAVDHRRRGRAACCSGCASARPSSSRSKGGRSPTATRSVLAPRSHGPGERNRSTTTTSPCELGAHGNPPGFDANLVGLNAGDDEDVHDPLPRGLRRRGDGRNTDVDLRGHRQGHPAARCCPSSTTSSRRTSASSSRSPRCASGSAPT